MPEQQRILVIGATGNVGRQVVHELLPTTAEIRALARNPESANLPAGVDVVRGDLTAPGDLDAALRSVDTVFLLWPFTTADGAPALVDAIARQAERVVYLSAMSADAGFWGEIERLIEKTRLEWTFLRPGGFMANTLMWADQVRGGVVRWPYGALARSLIHEADIATVAVRALTETGHAGQRYLLTGPQAITQIHQVQLIADAVGHPVRWEELSRDEARPQLLAAWGDASFVDAALDSWAAGVDDPEPVTSTVAQITGRAARPFRDWTREHVTAFR
jgi:uncharacterized protein YbjT (DUF2867 family)